MKHPPLETDPLTRHARAALSPATGRTLSLLAADQHVYLPGSADPIQHWPDRDALTGVYESVVSAGQLGLADDLVGLLEQLSSHLDNDSVIYFCEPTRALDRRGAGLPNDVTTTFWDRGFTVFECWRDRTRSGLRKREYCWGRARLTPTFSPPRAPKR